MLHLKKSKKDKLSVSSSPSVALTKAPTASEKIPSPLSSASRPRDGTPKSSNLKMTKLNKSIMMSSTDSLAILAESTLVLFLTVKRFSLTS